MTAASTVESGVVRRQREARMPTAWRALRSIVAWPTDWQRPARTEEWAWEGAAESSCSPAFAQLVGFPWATLIDLVDRGHLERARPLLDALGLAPSRTTLVRATVCQHVRLPVAAPRMRALGITDVFWSHARVDQRELDGLRIHPFPLYPVRCFENRPAVDEPAPIAARPLLYSFVGAYSPDGYLTPVRQWIFDLPPRADAHVQRRSEWHYEAQVYGEQVARRALSVDETQRQRAHGAEYDRLLQRSIFSLCPSGAGPNSIRLWESLGFGAIPVLLADTLRLPGEASEWDDAIVRVPETREAVAAMPALLAEIARDRARLERMQQAGRRLWQRYGENGPATVLGVLADTAWVRARVLNA